LQPLPLQRNHFSTKGEQRFETKDGPRKFMTPDPGQATKFPFFFFSSKLRSGLAVEGSNQGLF
jgi:hypothetical protein